MRRVIRLGDKTSHGGEVVSAAENYTIMGKAVARMGDMATCPIKGHGACEIVEGDPYWTINGRNVALEGHKLRCGAALISSCGELGRSYEGDGAEGAGGLSASGSFPPSTAINAQNGLRPERYDEQVRLVANGGDDHLVGLPYFIEAKSGRTYSGRLNARGEFPRIETEGLGEYTVYWGDEALERLTS